MERIRMENIRRVTRGETETWPPETSSATGSFLLLGRLGLLWAYRRSARSATTFHIEYTDGTSATIMVHHQQREYRKLKKMSQKNPVVR